MVRAALRAYSFVRHGGSTPRRATTLSRKQPGDLGRRPVVTPCRSPHAARIVTNAERLVQGLAVRWLGADRLRRTEGANHAG